MNHLKAVSAIELASWLKEQPDMFQLLDVREAFERDICHIGGNHIPLSLLSELSEFSLEKNRPIVVYCRSGARSAQACHQLVEKNFVEVINLTGGILSWIDSVDGSLTRY